MIFLALCAWFLLALFYGAAFNNDRFMLVGFVGLCVSFACFLVNDWWWSRKTELFVADPETDWVWPSRDSHLSPSRASMGSSAGLSGVARRAACGGVVSSCCSGWAGGEGPE